MIFLTVGNWSNGFDRLVAAVDDLKARSIVAEEVFAQIGGGRYQPAHLSHVDFCSPEQFEQQISRARVIVSHAGMGTIARAILSGKPIIVVPRKASLGEHFDDHQFATAEALEKEHKVLVAYDVSELAAKLEEARTFVPNGHASGARIVQAVADFIEAVAARKGAQ